MHRIPKRIALASLLLLSLASFQAPIAPPVPSGAAQALPAPGRLLPAPSAGPGAQLGLGAGCSPAWLPTFGGLPGVNADVLASAVFDDGSGPALYVAGAFQVAGSQIASNIARWDGSSWSAVGGGIQGQVHALAVFDDGSGAGPALYVGGSFGATGGGPAASIARWNGSVWSAVGGGVSGSVHSLIVHDEGSGSGPALYVGGQFSVPGVGGTSNIARWNGTAWSALGGGVSGQVLALEVYDDGSGPALHAGGTFTLAGGSPANRVAKWSGAAWSALGGGTNGTVHALRAFDGAGSGSQLYVGGLFTTAGGVASARLAHWNGTTWTAMTAVGPVHALAVYDAGTGGGALLHVGGSYVSSNNGYLQRWNGSAWIGSTLNLGGPCQTLSVHDDGGGAGTSLYVGGWFFYVDEFLFGVGAANVARWNGSQWSPLGTGVDFIVNTLLSHDDGQGGGPKLIAGGGFKNPGRHVARWNGAAWEPLGAGIYGDVLALATHDDGSGAGPALYAGGLFYNAGTSFSPFVTKWNGSTWVPLGSGMDWAVRALVSHDEGAGPRLFAAGEFTQAGGATANRVARWNGSAWSTLGSGMNGDVLALAVHDDGTGGGAALYAGGQFTSAGGQAASRIARWNGSGWSHLGTGMNGTVHALRVHDDGLGGGPALYAGGLFTSAGGVAASGIAKWNGSAWSPLGVGISIAGGGVRALEVYDDGTGGGPALFVGGEFFDAGGLPASGIAKWDGAAWSTLGSGTSGPYVFALAAHDTGAGAGETLFVGGGFVHSPGGDALLANWGGCAGQTGPRVTSISGPTQLVLGACGSVQGTYQVTSNGALDAGQWGFGYWSGFPLHDGWSVAVQLSSPHTVEVTFSASQSTTTGSFPFYITWTGTCNGAPEFALLSISAGLSSPCAIGTPYCFGDGSATFCPCSNFGYPGRGCANSIGLGARLAAQGSASIAAADLVLRGQGLIPGQAALYFQGTTRTNAGNGVLFGDGLRCAGGTVVRIQMRVTNPAGSSQTTVDVAAAGLVSPGTTRNYQIWYRDPVGSPCGGIFNLSNGLEISWLP